MTHLVGMLTEQRKLQEELGIDLKGMDDVARMDYIKTMYIAAIQELGEALNETSWKTWSKHRHTNTAAFLSELSDAFQFIMNMFMGAFPEATSEELAEMFAITHATKIAINKQRIREGYDGSNKCPKCKRALDDVSVACDAFHCVIHD